MGAIGGEELVNWEKMQGNGSAREEKILVLVRLRPLSEKEIAKNEVSDWECINNTSILFRNSLQERSMFPTAYTFDRVFGGECPTRMVYDSGAKEIALSVVSGINSSIFAYGQTSSGKTYTMIGITEYTVADIYDYIQKHEERAFVLKFSAMEIYNEAVRDLLSTDNIPLRVLDDPEKGTIVEKLTEETLRGWSHLRDLLSICEAQRQTGETSLNETSSRSHQILRLTIESTAREFIGKDKSTTTLAASVNFVDLAGSERAAQALSVGQRLKEGCHINRSLLTLGTVIRKLSKGRQGHVNYRDSKLTRILQPCLGGNARTAIICTLSPARSHVEQSRNTLLFASCAKEVSTNAQVNVVMSDKALVKHLQKELARLESELRTPAPTSSSEYVALLRKKDLQIDKLEKEVKELTKQRDLAQSRIEELLTAVRKNQEDSSQVNNSLPENDEDDYMSDDDTESSQPNRNKFVMNEEDSDDNCKDVRCIEMDESTSRSPVFEENEESVSTTTRETSQVENGLTFGLLERNIQDVQNAIDSLVNPYDEEQSSRAHTPSSSRLKVARSYSCRANLMTGSSSDGGFGIEGQNESTPPPNGFERNFTGRPEGFQRRLLEASLKRNDSQSSIGSVLTEGLKSQNNTGDEDIPSVDSFVAGLKEMAKVQYDYQGEDDKSGKHVKNVGLDPMQDLEVISSDWPVEFERQQRLIFELWETCNVSVVHRTYFFLLFRGDPMDSIYMEVEIRRLSFLKEKFSSPNPNAEDGQTLTLAASIKALRRERETLSRLMYKRFSDAERNRMYEKWGISLESKRRRLQLVQRLWSDTKDMNHIEQSASIVAKLVRFSEQGQALKGMFGLSFTPPRISRRSFGWKQNMASLL